jgi:hypothetical protein
MKFRLFPSWYPLTPDDVGLFESYLLLEGHYLKKWFFYCFNINYNPLDYYIPTLYLMMAIQSRLFSSRYPLTTNAVGLLESSSLLEGIYFNNWFLYYFNINYSPLDYYIHTLYLMMEIQGRLLNSWYPLTPDAVGLMKSSPLLEGNYFNNLVYYNIQVIIIVD